MSDIGFEGTQNIAELLSTKLVPPRLSSSLIPRNALFSRLDSGFECKLTLVCAPAGFGKTTLLSTWVAFQSGKTSNSPLVAWVSLDERDNDPIRYWRYVLTAAQKFDTSLSSTALKLLHAAQHRRFEGVMTTFINELSALPGLHILVLDDYHLIDSPQIHETMAFLLDHLPATMHVIIASRNEPLLPLARWRAHRDMFDLSAADLRFSLEETQTFLQQALPYSLPLPTISHVHTHTEGWAVGLLLVALALQPPMEEHQREHTLMSFTGTYGPVEAYLVSDVLNTQPDRIQNFLLRTSLLSRLTGSLCNAVVGGTTGDEILHQLEKANLFLNSLDGDGVGEWYRYHVLFAETLKREALRRFGESEICSIYLHASQWYEAHEMLFEAVEVSLLAAEFEHSACLIERAIETRFKENKELYTLRRWLALLPAAILWHHPELCFVYARALFFTQEPQTLPDLPQIENLLDTAEAAWQNDNNTMRLDELLIFRSVLGWLLGERSHAMKNVRQILDRLPPEDIQWRSISLNIIGIEEFLAGEFNAARQTFLESLALTQAARNHSAIRATMLLLSNTYVGQGELDQAAELYRQVLSDADRDDDLLDKAKALLGLAGLSYEWNHLDDAAAQARSAFELSKQPVNDLVQGEASLILAHILHVQGQTALAQHNLGTLMAQTKPHPLRQLQHEILTFRAYLYLTTGNLAEVEEWIIVQTHSTVALSPLQHEREALLKARLLIAQGNMEEALQVLSVLYAMAHDAGRIRSTLEIQLVMVQAYIADRDRQSAKGLLQGIVLRTQPAGYQRLFLDEGVTILSLLKSLLVPQLEQSLIATYLKTLLNAAPQRSDPLVIDRPASTSLNEPLTAQEDRILDLFANGLSKKEIADELLVSINTVKTHLQRIYQKLNVNSRAEAREVSRRLKLLR